MVGMAMVGVAMVGMAMVGVAMVGMSMVGVAMVGMVIWTHRREIVERTDIYHKNLTDDQLSFFGVCTDGFLSVIIFWCLHRWFPFRYHFLVSASMVSHQLSFFGVCTDGFHLYGQLVSFSRLLRMFDLHLRNSLPMHTFK